MLDQNTDRMWFVIGAVIVGAAIIFIANGTLPEIFASVTQSFEDVANEGTQGIESIVEVSENHFDISLFREGLDAEVYHKTGRWGYGGNPNTYDSYILELNLKPNTEYTISTNIPEDDRPGSGTIYLNTNHTVGATKIGKSVTTTTDDDGYLFVGMVKGRKYTKEVFDGVYWVMLVEGDTPYNYKPYY